MPSTPCVPLVPFCPISPFSPLFPPPPGRPGIPFRPISPGSPWAPLLPGVPLGPAEPYTINEGVFSQPLSGPGMFLCQYLISLSSLRSHNPPFTSNTLWPRASLHEQQARSQVEATTVTYTMHSLFSLFLQETLLHPSFRHFP